MMDDDIRPVHGVDSGTSGRQVLGGYLDEREKLIYFGRRGDWIPVGSAVNIPIASLAVFVLWFLSLLILTRADDRSTARTVTGIMLIVVLVLALTVPFPLRRVVGNEGRLEAALKRGDVISMRMTQPLARDLLGFAESHAIGYFEQAEELARADALRLQSEQMRELHAAASVAGARDPQLVAQLAAYADRLDAAAADREATVRAYLEGGRRG